MPYTIPSYTVNPGSVYQPKSKLILDQISGAIAAWSTRRLISSSPAGIARGRDASTTEEDFTAAELAGSGFTTLAGAGDGFYVTLYDQIGSNNATQATAARQPKGVDTGSLITDSAALPVLQCNGANYLVAPDSATFDIFDNFTITVRYNDNNIASVDYIISKWDQNLVKQWALVKNTTFGFQFIASPDGSTTVIYLDTTNKPSPSVWNVSTISFSGGVVQFYLNGTKSIAIDNSGSITSIHDGATDVSLCSRLFNGGGNGGLTGDFSDAIIFNRVLNDAEVLNLHAALA